jgi:hypothetical protein
VGADTPTGRRRLPGLTESLVLLFAFGMMAVGGLGGATGATFSGQAGNPANPWATFSVAPPGTISPVQSGSNVNVSWGASSNASSYLVQGGSAAKTASCTSVTWSTLSASIGTTTYTDTGRVTSSVGSYYCYQVTSNDVSGWTSVNNPSNAFSVGLWISSWSWANALSTLTADCGAISGYGSSWGKAGTLDCGDTITITFSAPVDQTLFTTANSSVCVFKNPNNFVLLGDTTASGGTACGTADSSTLGKITATQNLGANAKYPLYSVSWTGNQVVLTLGPATGTPLAETTGTVWTLTPTVSLAAPSGGQGQVGCTVSACQKTYSGSS